MHNKKTAFSLLITGVALVMLSAILLTLATPVHAQCGSQASSCKNCHEVQGEYPVNNDGTSWHEAHAFGDFCYICHGGNQQATDADTAHEGMVPPLSDVQASCQQCHFDDLEERAQVYADTLGIEYGMGATAPSSGTSETTSPPASESSLGCNEIVVDDPNLVDYNKMYEEATMGIKNLSVGNAILGLLIGALVLGGGGFILYNEGWVGVDYENVDEYPEDLVEMLPEIAHLTPPARKKLQRILGDTKDASELLSKIDDASKEENEK